jgi:hypothetical protein
MKVVFIESFLFKGILMLSATARNKKVTFPPNCFVIHIQGGALNRGLFFADPPLSLLGAVSGKISEIR